MTATPARRRPSIVPGILLAILGLILLAVGGVIAAVNAVAETVQTSAPTEIPQTLSVDDLGSGGWAVYLTDDQGEPYVNDPTPQISCEVVNQDATQTVTGTSFLSSESNDLMLIGSFRSGGGAAQVTCDWIDGHESTGYFFVIMPANGIPVAGIVLLVLGGLVVVGGGLLIVRWAMGRRRA